MKIGILTHFHKSTNYGGVLQAYALCRYLNDRGHSASQILYTAKVRKLDPSKRTAKEFLGILCKRIKQKIYKKKNKVIKQRMEDLFFDFRDHVPHTEKEYIKNNISDVAGEFDIIIAGSDQIWNPDWYDSSYMLDFVDTSVSKISYAASMGVSTLTEEQKKTYVHHLFEFKMISVREKECADVVSNVVGHEVEICIDPTLLLTSDEWDDIAGDRRIFEKYVFLYMLGNDCEIKITASKFAQRKGLRLVCIPDLMGEYTSIDRKLNAHLVYDATPSDFISLIKYADYIFTDSFHASVFSLLYQKEFYVFDKRAIQKTSSRICNLTEMFECKNHYFSDNRKRTLKYIMNCPPIAYLGKKTLFDSAKKRSEDFLNSGISEGVSQGE